MAMGLCAAHDFEKEISNLSIVTIKRGRGEVTETPSALRKLIAGEVIAGATHEELSKEFGISKSSISAYAHGATSTASYNKPDPELKASNDTVRERITGAAQEKLMAAIEAITAPELKTIKVRDKASVAVAMSSVIRNVSGNDEGIKIQNNIHVFAPRKREEDDYEVITVND